MKALDLYEYIEQTGTEWHYANNQGYEDVLIFAYFYNLQAFYQLLDPTIFDDEGIECVLKDGYMAIWMSHICEYYGIELDEVFPR